MNTKMKFLIKSLLLLGFSFSAYAVGEGPYIQLDIGQSKVNATSASGAIEPDNNTGIGVDFIMGAQISRYGAVELGLTHYANVSNKATDICDSSEAQTNSLDILGKGIFPVSSFGVFAKGGFSMIRTAGDADTTPGHCGTKTQTLPRLKAALGVTYDLTQTSTVELTYSRVFVNSNFVNTATMVALGISYHFADTYCGQFLC